MSAGVVLSVLPQYGACAGAVLPQSWCMLSRLKKVVLLAIVTPGRWNSGHLRVVCVRVWESAALGKFAVGR